VASPVLKPFIEPTGEISRHLSKEEMVKRALSVIGPSAKIAELRDWIEMTFGGTISSGYIHEMRKRHRVAAPVTATKSTILVEDIVLTKELITRVGVTELHLLIDTLSK